MDENWLAYVIEICDLDWEKTRSSVKQLVKKMGNSIQVQVQKWCNENDWTDLFVQQERFYAFPPSAVIPLPVPTEVIEKATINVRKRNLLFLVILFIQIVIVLNTFFYFSLWLSMAVVIFLGIFMLIDELWSGLQG